MACPDPQCFGHAGCIGGPDKHGVKKIHRNFQGRCRAVIHTLVVIFRHSADIRKFNIHIGPGRTAYPVLGEGPVPCPTVVRLPENIGPQVTLGLCQPTRTMDSGPTVTSNKVRFTTIRQRFTTFSHLSFKLSVDLGQGSTEDRHASLPITVFRMGREEYRV